MLDWKTFHLLSERTAHNVHIGIMGDKLRAPLKLLHTIVLWDVRRVRETPVSLTAVRLIDVVLWSIIWMIDWASRTSWVLEWHLEAI